MDSFIVEGVYDGKKGGKFHAFSLVFFRPHRGEAWKLPASAIDAAIYLL
jgi:hypothetical protein